MITKFDKHTQPLDQEELNFVPSMIIGFKNYTKEQPIKAKDIVNSINASLRENGFTKKFTEARLRKIVNYIRANSLHPVMSSSAGYYTSYNTNEINEQIKSMRERAAAINNAAAGLEKFKTLHSYQTA